MKIFFYILFVFKCLFSWQAAEHPVRQIRVTSRFGESRGDHFHTGTDYAGVQTVYPVDKGLFLFGSDYSEDPTKPVMGSGNFAIIVHENDYRSFYFHLKSSTINDRLTEVSPDTPLAIMGDSGHSIGNHLHFVIENKDMIYDSALFTPPIADSVPPRVHRLLFVKDGSRAPYSVKSLRSSVSSRAEMQIYVIAWDLKPGLPRGTPFNLSTICGVAGLRLFIDDKLIRDYDFTKMKKTRSGLVLTGGHEFKDVFGNPYNYFFGKFTPSKRSHRFTIECEDLAGHKDRANYLITFYN